MREGYSLETIVLILLLSRLCLTEWNRDGQDVKAELWHAWDFGFLGNQADENLEPQGEWMRAYTLQATFRRNRDLPKFR